MWETKALGKSMSMWKRTDTKTREPRGHWQTGQVKAKAEAKGKKRTLETCMCCGKEGQKKADCKFKTATCASCGEVSDLRAVCRNTNTHEIEKVANEPNPEVTFEEV